MKKALGLFVCFHFFFPFSVYADWNWAASSSVLNPSGWGRFQNILPINNGESIAVWVLEDQGTTSTIQISRLQNGVWSAPSNLYKTQNSLNIFDVTAAKNSQGEIVVGWSEGNDVGGATIKTGRLADMVLSNITILDTKAWYFVRIASSGNGTFAAVWDKFNGVDGNVIKASVFDQNYWSQPITLSESGRDSSYQQIVGTSSGEYTVVWRTSQNQFGTIQSTSFKNGNWSDITNLTPDNNSNDAASPSLALDKNDNITCAWEIRNAYKNWDWLIQATRKSNGVWGVPVDISSSGRDSSLPSVAANEDSEIMVAWRVFSLQVIQASIFSSGQWSPPVNVSTAREYNQAFPKVFGNHSHGFVVGWNMIGQDNYSYLQTRTYANGVWSKIFDLGRSEMTQFTLAFAPNNDATMLWSNYGNITAKKGSFEPFTQAVEVTKTAGGFITSTPGGIDCGVKCIAEFAEGSQISLAATPETGYAFKGWGGACAGTAECSLVMDGTKNVSATFEKSFSLDVSKSGDGIVTSSPAGINCGSTCSASFSSGALVTLTPSAGSGYSFINWTGACSGSGTCTVTMDGAKSVSAVFTATPPPPPVNFTLNVSKTGPGTITSVPARISCGSTCSAEISDGSNVSLIAQPDYGFAFAGWSGACSGTGTCAVTMNGEKSVSANFIELPKYPVMITKPSTGVVRSEPAGIVCGGPNRQCLSSFSSAKLTGTPNPGYEFIRWNGCQAPEGNICYIKPTGKMTVNAVFKKLPKYNVKISKNNLGSITSIPGGLKCPDKKRSCSVKFVKGTQVTLTALPQAGRSFGGWTGACSGFEPCTFLVDGNKGIGAMFQ